MPENERTWQLVDLPGRKKNLAPSVLRGAILILAFLCKGMLSQHSLRYSIDVPLHVSVQRGLSTYISCQFTYDSSDLYRYGEKLFGYWFKLDEEKKFCFTPFSDSRCFQGRLMATNDNSHTVDSSAVNRFYLTGDPNKKSCSFIIVNAQLEDTGQYYFRIEGEYKLKYSYHLPDYSTSPQVSVTEKPQDIQITVIISRRQQHDSRLQKKEGDLEPVVAQEGDTVNLLCQANGSPEPTLTWRNQNKAIIGSQNESLSLFKVGLEAAGEYECQAVNPFGSAEITIRLIVQYSPRTVTFNVSQASRKNPALTRDGPREVADGSQLMAEEGNSLWLLCKANSNPPAKTNWAKEGMTLENFPDNWLELSNLTVTDEGEYTCQAENVLGSVQGTFHLYVAYAPKVSPNSQRNTTCWYKDNGFVCDCSFSSKPVPKIQWQVDGKMIIGNSNESNQEITSLLQGEEITSSLNWTGSLESDHRITCTGRNAFGVYTVQFLLSSLKDSTIMDSFTGSPTPWFVSGLSGGFLAASLIVLGLWLIKFYNRRKALSKVASVEPVDPTNGEHQRGNNNSLIYSNILPVTPRTPRIGPSKGAEERSLKPNPVPRVPNPNAAESEQLHYAALEFNLKSKGVPKPGDESTEYSAIR